MSDPARREWPRWGKEEQKYRKHTGQNGHISSTQPEWDSLHDSKTSCFSSLAELAKADQAPALTYSSGSQEGTQETLELTKYEAFGSPLENGPDSFSRSFAPELGKPHRRALQQMLTCPFRHSGKWTEITCSVSLAAVSYVSVCSASPLSLHFFENISPHLVFETVPLPGTFRCPAVIRKLICVLSLLV